MCDECALINDKRETAYMRRFNLENQLLVAGSNWTNSLADDYARVLSDCDILYAAYRAHQQLRHGVTVNYVAALSGGAI